MVASSNPSLALWLYVALSPNVLPYVTTKTDAELVFVAAADTLMLALPARCSSCRRWRRWTEYCHIHVSASVSPETEMSAGFRQHCLH